MKLKFHARVTGHEMFLPDKDNADDWAVRVKLLCQAESPLGKPWKGAIAIKKNQLDQFKLAQSLRITIEDSQQELQLTAASKDDGAGDDDSPPTTRRSRTAH